MSDIRHKERGVTIGRGGIIGAQMDRVTKKQVNAIDMESGPKIVVLGMGGGGGNAVECLIAQDDLKQVKKAVCNTDVQDLSKSSCEYKVQIGISATRGLGAGGDPENGAAAAEESIKEILEIIEGADVLFLTCGEGGGTGTGVGPVVAKAAREAGILTLAAVTKPFGFEGKKRAAVANAGIAKLQEVVDGLLVIPNDNVLRVSDQSTLITDAFKAADNVLASFVTSIVRVLTKIGIMNSDFADIKAALSGRRARLMVGIGEAEGEGRGLHAAERALSNPLLEDCCIKHAYSVILMVEGGDDMGMYDTSDATNRVQQEISEDEDDPCKFVYSILHDPSATGKMRVTSIAAVPSTIVAAQDLHRARNKRQREEFLNHDLDEDFITHSKRRHVAFNEDADDYDDEGDDDSVLSKRRGVVRGRDAAGDVSRKQRAPNDDVASRRYRVLDEDTDDYDDEETSQGSSAPEPTDLHHYEPRRKGWWEQFAAKSHNSIAVVRYLDDEETTTRPRYDDNKKR